MHPGSVTRPDKRELVGSHYHITFFSCFSGRILVSKPLKDNSVSAARPDSGKVFLPLLYFPPALDFAGQLHIQ